MSSNFTFTIPAGAISPTVGNLKPATAKNITIDRGFTRRVRPRTLVARFGDGYEQRVGDGINTKDDTLNISLKNRTADEINEIAAFFDAFVGKSFTATVSEFENAGKSFKVVCESYNITYVQPTVHSLTAVFRRVYEP